MMRLGRDTGSPVNSMLSHATKGQPDPVVGMGATVLMWTDRHAATIVSVLAAGWVPERLRTPGATALEKRWLVGVQEDKATVVKGSEADGSAEYEYAPDPAAPVKYWRFDGVKGWRRVVLVTPGDTVSGKLRLKLCEHDGSGLRIGEREEYRDPSF